LLMTVGVKKITDFTGAIQFRGDAELGGLFWRASDFEMAVLLYQSQHFNRRGSGNLSPYQLWISA